MKRWLYTALITVLALIFLISGFFLVRYYLESEKQQSQFDELAQMVAQKQTEPKSESALSTAPTGEAVPEDPYAYVTDPDTGKQVQLLEEYAQLYLRNNHLVGWMCIEGTKINYPVMQTPKESNYYLKHDFDRQDSQHGCLYVQENCDVAAPSDNLIIYGHNMRDGSMFAALHGYKKESFWQEHQTITFNTLREYRTYQIVSVFYTSANEGQGFAFHQFVHADDETAFNDFVRSCKALSLYDTGADAVYGDKLITLSTCEYSQANGRLIVVAKCMDN